MDAKVTEWLTVGMRASYYNASNPGQIANIQSATWLSPYSHKYVRYDGYTDWYERYAMVMLPVRSGVLPKLLPICGQIAIRNMIT